MKTVTQLMLIISIISFCACKQANPSPKEEETLAEEVNAPKVGERVENLPDYGDAELFNLLYEFREEVSILKAKQLNDTLPVDYTKAYQKLEKLQNKVQKKISGMPEEEAFVVEEFIESKLSNVEFANTN